jgi:hypothetical protein
LVVKLHIQGARRRLAAAESSKPKPELSFDRAFRSLLQAAIQMGPLYAEFRRIK